MGVRGLSTFFKENPDFFKPHKLYNSFIIIDGDNLIHTLYYGKGVNPIFGGDYQKYADAVKKYLLAFLKCEIKPIIIFDGGYDKSGRKLRTILERAEERLTQVKYIANSYSYYERILPILARETFLSVLVELDIAFALCDYEADDQITALANYYKCPVVSADSDFYIYDVHEGYIRIDSIDTTINVDIDSDGKEYRYLNCSLYHIDEFVSCFPGIDKCVLPLFGTLIGNDYVEVQEFKNFFANIHLPKYNGRKLIVKTKQKRMIGLLCWLKNTTLDEAVEHVMQYLKKNKREYVRSVIEDAVSGYTLRHCNLTHVIDSKLHNLKLESCLSVRLTTPCGYPLPLDFIIKFHSGQYCSFFINVIAMHKVFLLPQIEDISSPSSHQCARSVREVMYGILIRHNVGDVTCQNEKCLAPIEENERHGKKFQKQLVEPTFSVEGVGMLPIIDELDNLKKEKSLLILTKVLDVDLDYFSDLPKEWQLLIGCIKYWLCNCEPHCTESFLYALVINLLHLSIVKNYCFDKKNQYKCLQKKRSDAYCSCSSIDCLVFKVRKKESLSAASNLRKYLKRPSVNHANPLCMPIMHSYSQLQSCFINIITLNKLLGEFEINPTPQRCFSGTLLYNLAKEIPSRPNAQLFIAELLGRESNLYVLFTALLSKICQHVPSEYIVKNQPSVKKRKKKTTKNSESSNKCSQPGVRSFDILNSKEIL